MSYEDKKNIGSETEMLSSDEQNVFRLLSNLKRVDVPKDFDFHLKARIANASPGDYRPAMLLPVLKYALPLFLFLVVGTAFVFINSYTDANVPTVADITNEAVPPSRSSNPDSGREIEVANAPTRQPDDVLTAANPKSVEVRSAVDNTREERTTRATSPLIPGNSIDSNSIDRAIKKAPDTRGPRFGNTNSNSSVSPERMGPSIPLQFREMLTSLGIDASDAGEKMWKVMRLTKDGIAERSGLRVDDVMEAIDDKPIDSLYDGSFSVKSIGVRRDGKVVKIDIKNN